MDGADTAAQVECLASASPFVPRDDSVTDVDLPSFFQATQTVRFPVYCSRILFCERIINVVYGTIFSFSKIPNKLYFIYVGHK